MCVGCLVTSAILAFSPVQPGLAPEQLQVNFAQQKQVAIARVIKNLPATSDVSMLKEGLTSIQAQLSVAIDETEARQILKTEVADLSQRITNDPKGKIMFNALDRVIAETDEVQPLLQSKSLFNGKKHTLNWGWLN
jgi:hypothetical protein